MLDEFLRQQSEASADKPVLFELSTSGGDADFGRRIAQEIRQWRNEKVDFYFLGKSFVYSAGMTIMGAFNRQRRFLSADCELLTHERRMKKTLRLSGALRASAALVKNTLAEIQSGERLEREGFRELVEGSSLTLEDLQDKLLDRDWYVPAAQAQQLGLVAGIAR